MIPSINDFYPLDSQLKVINHVNSYHKKSTELNEIMLSGTVGSAKSLGGIHAVTVHCLKYPGAVVGIGRKALPRLKDTVCNGIIQHLDHTGVEYKYTQHIGAFRFSNGSRIVPFSWSDKNFKKFRSYELSAMLIEEGTENDDNYKECYFEAVQRIRSKIPERWIMVITNPDSPAHWLYKHFYLSDKPNRFVFESTALDNPHLPPGYLDNLREILDEKQALRMIEGKWVALAEDIIYYAYSREHNYRNYSYEINKNQPIYMSWDFNIGDGKPLSVAFLQHTKEESHVYNEVVVEGQRTLDACEEAFERGLLPKGQKIIIHGDASGRSRDTRSKRSDYAIIENFLANNNLNFEIDVPTANPRLRDRHNIMNARICNSNNKRGLFIYKDAPTADEAMRLTSLKKNGSYIEDDSKSYQHIGTAIGYSVCQMMRKYYTQASTVENLSRFGLMR